MREAPAGPGIMYGQCRLRREVRQGVSEHTTSWLPERFAVEGGVVRLRGRDGVWADGWRVESASGEALPERVVNHRSRDHVRQRAASDI